VLRLGIGAHTTPGCMRSTQRTSRFSRRKFLRFQAFCVRNAMDLYQEYVINSGSSRSLFQLWLALDRALGRLLRPFHVVRSVLVFRVDMFTSPSVTAWAL